MKSINPLKLSLLVVMCFAISGLSETAARVSGRTQGFEKNIIIDCSREIGPLNHFWHSTGFSPANLLLSADMQQAMAYVGSIPHEGIIYVRAHYLLELVSINGFGTDHVSYDWTALDKAIDVLVRNGLKPLFELMGYPAGIFVDFLDGSQLHAWKKFIYDLALHYIDKYGENEVESWLFETWNEPDIKFWNQSEQAFMNYYDACSEGLKEADEHLRLGGPGTAHTLSKMFKQFLAHCDSERNFFTGKKGVRLDFISVHEKGIKSHEEDITPKTDSIIERELSAIKYIRQNHPKFKNLPFINDECDPQVGWDDIHTWRATPYYAAIASKIIDRHLKLIDEYGINYELLSNDNGFLGTWGNRTLLTRFGKLKNVDIGQTGARISLLRFQEDPNRRRFALIKKPIFNVMVMLSLLGDQRLQIIEGGDDPEVGIIPTKMGKDQIAILIYNSRDNIYSSGAQTIHLNLQNIPFAKGLIAHYRIDYQHTNPFKIWEELKAPDMPTSIQLATLRKHQELELLQEPKEEKIKNGLLSTVFDLPLPGVSLILISKKPDHSPEKVQKLKFEKYDGLYDDGEVLLLWDEVNSRFIRTYEVLFSPTKNGVFQRVNDEDLLCTAFLLPAKKAHGYFKVRAIDYWRRKGEESEIIFVGPSKIQRKN